MKIIRNFRIAKESSPKPRSVEVCGRALKKGFTENDANPEQLEMGIKIEMEHTDDPSVAKIIALDHLSEIPDYYTRLKKMEEDAGIKD